MVTCGFIGALVGRIFTALVNEPGLDSTLGVIAAFDGLGIVSLVHVLLFQAGKNQDFLKPSAAFLMFFAVGTKCGQGHGVGWLIFTGVANAIVASLIAFGVLGLLRPPTMDDR
jgi:hypothetical protein